LIDVGIQHFNPISFGWISDPMASRDVLIVRFEVQLADCTFHKGNTFVISVFKFTLPGNSAVLGRENILGLLQTFVNERTTGSRLILLSDRVEPEEVSAPILRGNSRKCQKVF
jgi:hypothetical protein